MGALERARADIEAGRLWKARDRLQGALGRDPAAQDVLGLLGEVHFAMGDLPAAGRHWFLTERRGEEADAAHAALCEQVGRNAQRLLVELPVKPPLDCYPPPVRERLERLVDEAREDGFDWHPKARRVSPRTGDDATSWVGTMLLWAFLLPTIGVWLLGVAFLVILVVRLV